MLDLLPNEQRPPNNTSMPNHKTIRSFLSIIYRNVPQPIVSKLVWRYYEKLSKNVSQSIIHCIGDSHASFFSGQDGIKPLWPAHGEDRIPVFLSYRLGPILAYNLPKLGTSTQGREKLFTLLINEIPVGSNVLLVFGEIDCRTYLAKRALLLDEPSQKVVFECAYRYFSVIREMQKLGYEILVWNVIPSTRHDLSQDGRYPTYGTCQERNGLTALFNHHLQKMASTNSIPFISIYGHLVDPDGLTNMSFYRDSIHLSQKAMPFALEAICLALREEQGLVKE